MANEFKTCPNGHYYQGKTCPYCKSVRPGNVNSPKTEVFEGGATPTVPVPEIGSPTKTTVVGTENVEHGNGDTEVMQGNMPGGNGTPMSSRTEFGDEEDMVNTGWGGGAQNPVAPQNGGYRTTRKLVGWLVSYTLDPMGVDFKLYEGRNIVGRNPGCNISVNDNMVSGEHAVILFRAGKYSITDKQSSHGTFVNGNDIELEPCYLQDGDEIRMGKTLFKFRTSL